VSDILARTHAIPAQVGPEQKMAVVVTDC